MKQLGFIESINTTEGELISIYISRYVCKYNIKCLLLKNSKVLTFKLNICILEKGKYNCMYLYIAFNLI